MPSSSSRSRALTSTLILLLLGCHSIAPLRPAPSATSSVYIIRRAWHIDIGFATDDLQPPLRSLAEAMPPSRYLEFGFGDRHYLMTRAHGAGNLLVSIWPGAALILMTVLKAPPQRAFGPANVVVLPLAPAQALALQQFVWRSLYSGATPAPVAAGPYPGSIFYAATGSYSGLHTCNTWAAEALRSAGLPVNSRGVLFAGQLWSQVRRLQPATPNP